MLSSVESFSNFWHLAATLNHSSPDPLAMLNPCQNWRSLEFPPSSARIMLLSSLSFHSSSKWPQIPPVTSFRCPQTINHFRPSLTFHPLAFRRTQVLHCTTSTSITAESSSLLPSPHSCPVITLAAAPHSVPFYPTAKSSQSSSLPTVTP